MVEQHVVERVLDEMVARGDLDRMVASVATDERAERLVRQVLESPTTKRILTEALESQLTIELTDHLVQSPELQRVLQDAVRSAVARQTATLADTVAASAHRADRSLEAGPRRWLHRSPETARAYAGLTSRAAAFLVDSAVVHLGFLLGCGLFTLLAWLIGSTPSHQLAEALAGIGWTLLVAIYFVGFWAAAGQTPGMRLLRLRLAGPTGGAPSPARAVVRLLASLVAVAVVLLGFLPVLFDDRRRALQDFVAGTVVVYEPPAQASSAAP